MVRCSRCACDEVGCDSDVGGCGSNVVMMRWGVVGCDSDVVGCGRCGWVL